MKMLCPMKLISFLCVSVRVLIVYLLSLYKSTQSLHAFYAHMGNRRQASGPLPRARHSPVELLPPEMLYSGGGARDGVSIECKIVTILEESLNTIHYAASLSRPSLCSQTMQNDMMQHYLLRRFQTDVNLFQNRPRSRVCS